MPAAAGASGRGRRVGRAERVVFALGALGEAGEPAALAERTDAVAAAGQDLVRVGLMADVPDQAIARRIEDVMQRDRQLHRTEVGRQMAAGPADRAYDEFAQLARERFVICAVVLNSLAVGFHFAGEIAQSGHGLRAMLAVFVPIIRPQGKKDADSNEDNLKEQVEERALSAAEAHGREYGRAKAWSKEQERRR